MIDWCLTPNVQFYPQYHVENKLHVREMVMMNPALLEYITKYRGRLLHIIRILLRLHTETTVRWSTYRHIILIPNKPVFVPTP